VTAQCQAVCDDPGGLQPGAAWAMRGGCPTRRGQSPFTGPDLAQVKWKLPVTAVPANDWVQVLIDAAGGIYAVPYLENPMLAISSSGTLTKTYGTSSWGDAAIGADGTLYAPTMAGLSAIDPTSGSVKWSAGMQSEENASVAIAGDGTLFSTSGADVVAVTPAGAVKWTAPQGNFGLETAAAVAPDGTVYVVTLAGLVALHANGSPAWTRPLRGYSEGTPAIGHDGTVYVGNGSHAYAFEPDGTMLWDVDLVDPVHMVDIAIGPDDTLFASSILSSGAALYHLSPSNGSTLWQFAVPGLPNGWRMVVDALGRIYASMGGFVYGLRCDGSPMWTFTKGNCYDLAIGSDGRLYVGCADSVVALGP
jgi:outer membrane protein assembly factor BamB